MKLIPLNSKLFIILQNHQFGHPQIVELKIRLLHFLLHFIAPLVKPKQPLIPITLINEFFRLYQLSQVLFDLLILLFDSSFCLYFFAYLSIYGSLLPMVMESLQSISSLESIIRNVLLFNEIILKLISHPNLNNRQAIGVNLFPLR